MAPAPVPLWLQHIIWSHAVLATLSVALFFPLGAVVVRVVTHNARNIHWPIQVLAMTTFTGAFVLGCFQATHLGLWVTFNGHAIIGTILYCLTLTMPILGLLHHFDYVSTKNSYKFAWIHVWLGRIIIIGGTINGGLGLQLAFSISHNPAVGKAKIAYGVVAGLIAVTWITISIVAVIRSHGDVAVGGESGPKIQGITANNTRTNSADTAAAEKGLGEKFDEDNLNGRADSTTANGVTDSNAAAHAATPAVQTSTHGHTTTTTTTTTTVAGGAQQGSDTVHGGEHYNTRLADVIDPAVQKSEETTMFG